MLFVDRRGVGVSRPCADFQARVILMYMTYQIKSAELIHALHKNSNKCVLVAGLFSKLTGTLYWVNSDFENMQLIEKVSVQIHFTLDLFLLSVNLLYNIVR